MSRPNRTISLPGNDPGLDTAPPDWQLNLPRSIRDIVRRERWATAYDRETGAVRARWPQADDSVTFTIRLPWPDRDWIDAVLASNAEDTAKLERS